MYGNPRISKGRQFAEKFYDDTTPYSPYVVLKYQFVPQDTVGKYIQSKVYVPTSRGVRSYRTYSQNVSPVKNAEAYLAIVEKSDRKMQEFVTRTSLNTLHDTYTVVVGVIDKAILHSGPGGENVITYEDLFGLLAALGFDPLAPVRRRQSEFLERLGAIVRDEIAKGDFSKESIKAHIVAGVANEMVNAVTDYIYGGAKPSLARSTTEEWRPEKKSRYPGLYQGKRGINEPLYETGELFEAIECNVFSSQSAMMKSYLKELRDIVRHKVEWNRKHKEKVLAEARQKKAMEKGIEKYKRSMQRQSGKLKRMSEFEMNQLRGEALRMIRGLRPSQRVGMMETFEKVFGEHGTKSIPESEIKKTISNVMKYSTGGKRLVGARHLAPFAFFSMPKTAAEIEKYDRKILGMYKPSAVRQRRSARIVPMAEVRGSGIVDVGAGANGEERSLAASQWTSMDISRSRVQQLEDIVKGYDDAVGTEDAFRIRKYMMEKKLSDSDVDFARYTLDLLRRHEII